MSTASDKASHILSIAAAGLVALEAIGQMSAGILTSASTSQEIVNVLHVIDRIVQTVRAGLDGTMTAVDVDSEIAALKANLAANDQAARDALDKKFPT